MRVYAQSEQYPTIVYSRVHSNIHNFAEYIYIYIYLKYFNERVKNKNLFLFVPRIMKNYYINHRLKIDID